MTRTTLIVVALLCLAAGFAVGYLVRGPGAPGGPAGPDRPAPASDSTIEDARAAIQQLLVYHGTGPRASVKVRRWIERSVAGGEAVLPDLGKALENCGEHKYNVPGYSIDTRSLDLDLPPSRRTALLVAVDRIGGDESIPILLEAAKPKPFWIDHVTAYLFLARHADREDVQDLFQRAMTEIVDNRLNGPPIHRIIEILRGRLPAKMAPKIMEGYRAGWLASDTMDWLSEVLYQMDPARAGEFFESVLARGQAGPRVQAHAARSLARIPERRANAVVLMAENPQPQILLDFLRGLVSKGRFGSVGRYQDLKESGTPEQIRAFNQENLHDFELAISALEELEKRLDKTDPKLAQPLQGIHQALTRFKSARKSTIEAMEEVHHLR